ncbi:MAG: bifunctional riboflavin kinase/FAD synthetase [Actinomycetota bacterium]|nr:bifunctional riboflavin kinase/FAD synthetase [Actinomycetota bacterium]
MRRVVGPVVVALGNFDGVHLGHQVVVRRAVEEARSRGMRAVAVTFDPHPRAVLRPGSEPKLLTVLEVREELLLGCGVDEVRVLRFDLDLSKKSPGDFVREVLVGELGAGVVVVGENFRFGYKASGDVKDLDRHMRDAGGEAYAVPTYVLGEAAGSGEAINSTRIRMLLHDGEAREAARLLGRPYSLRGVVVEGDKRGHALGFPTANVLPGAVALVPGRGVYAGHVRVGEERYGACTNVGVAPTFERRESRVEAYLLDYEGDLYGEVIDVTFEERLRPEKQFSGVYELKEQIARDVAEARRVVGR